MFEVNSATRPGNLFIILAYIKMYLALIQLNQIFLKYPIQTFICVNIFNNSNIFFRNQLPTYSTPS